MSLRKLDVSPSRMFPAATHILGVRVAADRPVRVRRRYIIAERGTIAYRHEGDDLDEELRERVEQQGLSRAARDQAFKEAATKRVDIDVAGGLALTGNLRTHRASGEGEIWLGHEGGDVSIFEIADDAVVVLSQREILAHDEGLSATLEEVGPVQMAAVRDSGHTRRPPGPVLRALADASGADERVERAYRGLVDDFIAATARHIREEQARERIGEIGDVDEIARALIWLDERYLSETLGREPQADPQVVVEVLYRIWVSTLYGTTPAS